MKELTTHRIRVYGIVQGVGFRPFVSRAADKHHVLGSVCNKGPYVEIIARGTEADYEAFRHEVEFEPPERSSILKLDAKEISNENDYDSFVIIESAKEKGEIFVSPDIAICPKCQKELFDPSDRRYLHPFINCTACGPRLTILDAMPYDRERTSMKEFPMCDTCHYEYTHAETRRYDAQPVCCNDCGPEVYVIGKDLRGKEAITETRRTIAGGGIVAIKGIGGFHLCCDATNEESVKRLRVLKTRPAKPFAVMAKNLETARRECEVDEARAEVLDGHQKPIILLKRKDGGKICKAVSPDNPKIGVMLPYAPVQLLLFTYDDDIVMPDCLVMTSGNISGAPICRTDEDALSELSSMCDLILSHNRRIRLRADDSVMDFYKDKPYMVRRSRGYAPLPFMLSDDFNGQVLAVGGELKNTFCLGSGQLFYQSPYIGDMADVRSVKALRESIGRMETLLEIQPEIVARDTHPRYNTTLVAEELGLPTFPVQHHYAHIVACMAENDHPDPVIGVSFDGTGYGTDGTIWGGEFLVASYKDFRRAGSIKPFLQVGGDISAKEGWRIAVSMIHGIYEDPVKTTSYAARLRLCDEKDAKVQINMADHKINSVTSTSAGRLFDAVSAILGIRKSSTFEGEASMTLEFAAESYQEVAEKLPMGRSLLYGNIPDTTLTPDPEGYFELPTDQLVKDLIDQRFNREDIDRLAWLFHARLAEMIVAGCEKIREDTGIETVALSGGVFQNLLLLSLCDRQLTKKGFTVLTHSLIPPNDGGIALGQAVAAMASLNERRS